MIILKPLLILYIILIGSFSTRAQSGCTDPLATNYNASATRNNGSCTYASASINLDNAKPLPASLNRISGLTYTDGKLWSINDSGSAASVYRIRESDGAVIQTVILSGATNTDWEAITADAHYLYIGDFGNNANGNRTNLRIYRIKKEDIGEERVTRVTPDVINFSYQDQVITGPAGASNTDFDCEAILVKEGKIHLFTKEWIQPFNTKHYILPATPGNHIAISAEVLPVDLLITDASITTATSGEIVLIGYSRDFSRLSMWLLFDYSGDNFFSGNKRKIDLGSAAQGQIEGVTFTNERSGYISSEQISSDFINTPPQLYQFSVAGFLPVTEPITDKVIDFKAVYNPPQIALQWKLHSPKNVTSFGIERSANGINFEQIGELPVANILNNEINYEYLDVSPLVGVNYYRLKLRTQNGNDRYTETTYISTTGEQPTLILRPVPLTTGQLLHLELYSDLAEAFEITLTSTSGKLCYQQVIGANKNLKKVLQLDHLQRGLYILRVTHATYSHVAKIILQ